MRCFLQKDVKIAAALGLRPNTPLVSSSGRFSPLIPAMLLPPTVTVQLLSARL